MLASSKKPRGRRLRRWKEQRLFLARQRNQVKRDKPRRSSTGGGSVHDDDRVSPAELSKSTTAALTAPAKGRRLGLLGMMAAVAGIAMKPLRKKVARGR